jgi:peptidoglycan-N-acetylglucosamine deacetylase
MMRFLPLFFPSLKWKIPVKEKIIYLTFDDGPIPQVTPWVLEELKKYKATATFFCIGDNVTRYSGIYNSIIEQGHITGNHTQHHLNAWKVNSSIYIKDVESAAAVIRSDLFRPPYGKITPLLIRRLKNKYTIIMWDVLSYDFNTSWNGNQCAELVIKKAGPGSIVVFHDSLKAEARLRTALPLVLEHFSQEGYSFQSLR